MQRTRNVAMALMGVAVTAVSGCVAVEPGPAQELRPAPAAAVPSPGPGGAEPQAVQSPADETLERIAPSRTPAPDASAASGPRRQAPGPGFGSGARPADAERPPAPPDPGPVRPRERVHEQPEHRLPASLPSVPTLSEVCALGEGYGRWPADSPQARLCGRARTP
ncbi:hypothetical protein ACFXP3_02420 [Streptomyces sp. NPDC059096]|uniref:hypothetical protein n=1 Tax=Streptomyces sp. NPDC059096 TaxID=3346727 RepID=UPI003685AE89